MKNDVQKLFDSWARTVPPDYSRKQWLLSKWENGEGIDWPAEKIDLMLKHIAAGLDLRHSHRLVDLGCGGGWITKALESKAARVTGLDFALPMLTHAKEFFPEGKFICGDIRALPVRDASCERVLCYFVFINMMEDSDVVHAFREIQRILTRGGKALVGQLPDSARSAEYDAAKKKYLDYCAGHFPAAKNTREICRVPQKLFDKKGLKDLLVREKMICRFRDSFNPFYFPGQPATVAWRFDVILEKE